jgi:hypothetical protein
MKARVGSNLLVFQAFDLFSQLIHSLWKVYQQIVYVVIKAKRDKSYSSVG